MKKYSKLLEAKLPWHKLAHSNILIAGANGLIASNFVDMLIEANEIHSLQINVFALCRNEEKAKRRFSDYINLPEFHLIIQDVCSPLDLDVEFQYIVHGASGAHPKAFNTIPVDIMCANFLGTLNLLNYSRKSPKSRFLLMSSSEVYGENEECVETFKENMSGSVDYTKFRSCYPESKRASETLCMCFKKQYDSDVVIVRPAFIYGKNILENNSRADVAFLRCVLNGEDIVMYSEGTQIRSYCYVKDCVMGMLYALLLGESGEVYNIGNQSCVVTLREYAQALADIGGVKLIYDPSTAPQSTVFLKTTRCVLDTGKLEKLGWRPRYTLSDGIREMLSE